MWTCVKCKREFRNKGQWHSCLLIDLDEHFINKAPVVKASFEKLMEKTAAFGEITVNAVKSSIMVKAGSTFLGIKPKRDSMEVEFYLNYELKDKIVNKILVMSKNRIVHYITVSNQADINSKLTGLIRKSYKLVTEK